MEDGSVPLQLILYFLEQQKAAEGLSPLDGTTWTCCPSGSRQGQVFVSERSPAVASGAAA